MQIIAQKRALLSHAAMIPAHTKKKCTYGKTKPPAANGISRAGAGMGRALLMADEKRAYILSDSATFATLRDKPTCE